MFRFMGEKVFFIKVKKINSIFESLRLRFQGKFGETFSYYDNQFYYIFIRFMSVGKWLSGLV